MTHDEMRIAVAEELGTNGFYAVRKLGYYYRPNAQGYTDRIEEAGRYTKEEAKRQLVHGEIMDLVTIPPPNYPADLNACHEMESKAPRYAYYKELCKVVCGGPAEDVDDWAQIVSATAPQRCEAFLRVRGKWVETNNT